MKAKDIQDKVKALYANVEPDHFLKKDTYLIAGAIHSERIKEKHKDPAYRKKWLKSQRNKSAEEKERSRQLLISLNKKRYENFQYVFRTPGSDLLDFYDKIWASPNSPLQGIIKPSVVYRIRFLETYEKGKMCKKVLDICSAYVDITKTCESFPKDVKKYNYKWLTTEKSKQYVFDTYEDLSKFLWKKYKTKGSIPLTTEHTEHLYKFGKLAGCSLIKIEKVDKDHE